MKIIKF